MDIRKSIRNMVLGNDREKPVPEDVTGKCFYYLRYHFVELLGVNVLFVLCCLPIVTIPAACCGLSAVMTRLVREEPVALWSTFFREFKTDFEKRLVLWILMGIVPFSLAFYTTWFGWDRDGTVTRLICLTVLFLIQRYWYTCMALIEGTPLTNLKNAVLLMAVEWKTTLSVLFTAGVLYGACFLFPLYGFPVMVLCLFSVCCLLVSILLTPAVLHHLDSANRNHPRS